MCIICNLKDPLGDVGTAMTFLDSYTRSQAAMREATEAMLKVSRLDLEPQDRKRYDSAHKQMRRVMRDWNAIEHIREASHHAHSEDVDTRTYSVGGQAPGRNYALRSEDYRKPVDFIMMGESTKLEHGKGD